MNWIKLLDYYHKRNRTGPTIPFILGFEGYCSKERLTISQLLKEFTHSNIKIYVVNCSTIDSIVVTLYEKMVNPFIKTHKFGNLIINVEELSFIESIDELIDYLSTIYLNIVTNGKYSRIDREWVSFSPEDLKLLKQLK